MAEKRVSVRLSATGGRQVKDALRGVGEAGQQGFRRLSQEMEAANRRLARFARQATRKNTRSALTEWRHVSKVPKTQEIQSMGDIMHKPFLILTTCAALAGCSSVGTVNGVPVNQEANLSTQSGQGYCARQPAVCILGGVVAVGAVAALVDAANDNGGDGATGGRGGGLD